MERWGGIFKLLWSPDIDSKESIPRAYVARYGNPIPARFPGPLDCSKIAALKKEAAILGG